MSQHADNVIRQITFENEADSKGGSGKVILVNVKGREKPVFLIRGRYENGSITGETVVVSEGNGVIEMIPASEVEGIVEESDAMTERQREYDKIDAENKEQQRLINLNMDTPLAGQGGILMDEEGHRRQVGIKCVFNDEQGNPASVLVVDQNNNDYLIPIDVFREQRGRGRKFEAIEPYLDETDEEYHAAEGPMNEEYNLANKDQEGVSEEDAQGAAEGVTPQPATDATEKPTKPEVKYDYHVKMKDGSGNAVSGRVINLSADGVEIEFDAPYNGKMVDRIPLADFDNGVSEIADANGNVLWNETEAVGDTEVAPQVDAAPTQVGQNEIDESEKARQARINSSEYKYDKEMRVYGYTGHLYDYRNGVAIYLDEEGNPLIYLAAQNDNTYIGLFRDDSGMWSTKMENASNDKTVFKGLISAVMDMLPEGAKFYEHSNVSVDGLRVFAQQLNHGFKVSDETYECGLNGEDKANVLGSKFKGDGKFDSIKHATEADLEYLKGVLKPYMEALGRTTDDIRLNEDGKVLLTLPILIKEGTNAKAGEDVSASDVSNTQKNPTHPIHESASDEVDVRPAGSQEEEHKPTALERIPVNDAGERMFEQADKETALDALDEMTGHNSTNTAAIVKAQYKQAQADLDKLKKKAPTRKEPVLRGTPMEMLKAQQEADANYNTAMTQYNAQVAEAEAKLDAWTKIYALMNERERVAREQAEAEQRERDKKLHDEAVAKLEEQKRIAAEKAAEQEAVGTHAVNPKIKKKWNDAVKIEGNANAITLADGSTIRGRYVLTESGAATASHDVNNAYEPTEGFPIDENGESVNDRDYKRDKDAQRIVREMADNYDSRALQTPIIVSKDGVVLSGNNRTMSGELAAQQGTDKAYIDYLREFGKMFGFTSEQIEGMKHPRVVFVLDEALPYDAKTFARFNAEQQKRQSKPEHAVKLGKIVPDSVFASITNDISRFDRMSDFYADEKSVDSAISKLLEAGVINEMQLPELRTGNSLSASGKELIENALIGKVFQSSPDAVRQIIGNPTLRQSIIMGLNEIANNRTLAKSGYDLSQELGAAVDLVARAKTLHPDIYKEGVPVSPFGREQGLFDDEYGDSRVTDGIVLLLADLLNSGKPSELRKVLASYNNEAADFAAGQIDMFSGEVTSKEKLLNNVLNHFRNATPKEQQAIVDAAIAERKRRAEASKQVGDTSGRSGEAEDAGLPKGRKQVVNRLKMLNEASSPKDKLGLIYRIMLNVKNSEEGAITPEEQAYVDKVLAELKEQGYEMDNDGLIGRDYSEGDNKIVDDIQLVKPGDPRYDKLEDGQTVINRIIKPRILKDGKLYQAATVVAIVRSDTSVSSELYEAKKKLARLLRADNNNEIVQRQIAEIKAEIAELEKKKAEELASKASDKQLAANIEAASAEVDTNAGEENEEIKPIGKGVFGNIYDQFKGKVKAAFDFLIKHKSGDLLGVFHREGFGDIDLVWGSNENSEGLDHIIEKHIKAHNDFDSVESAINAIDDVIKNGSLNERKSKWDKAVFEKGGYMVVVRRNLRDNQGNVIDKNKNWIVTAFDSSKKQGDKKGELPSDVTRATPNTNKGGRAVTPNGNSSTDKVTESSPSPQENRPKNSTQAAVENKGLKPVRFEAGRRLTKEEKKEVLNTLRDAFKENGVPYHIEESDFGKERRVYEPTSEDWVKSDITGRPLRYYITLPDGRVAHPTELFPNISAREVTGHVNRMALLEKEASELISKQLNGFPSEYIPTAISILEKMQSLPHDVRDMGYGPYFLVSYDYIFNGKHYGNSPLFVSLFAHSVVKESSDAIEATVKVVNNSYYMVDALLSALKKKYNSTQSAVESASAEVETSPTEAQKKAGNYKMGHVKVGAFDVTIESPKGSERSGTDANGKKWSVKMNNTYGYIRGTEGVDGDHIDVFLAEDMDKWDGKYMFVVDQYNPDGTFDEHKVMLGFNSMEEARSAYLSNYEKGWENGRRIVVAKIKTDDFQKWVDSSHRKTKPFAHYVIAGAADVSDNEKKPSASKKGKPHVSKENEVKRTVEHFPMETPEEAAAFDKRVPEMKDSELLAYMQEDGKGDINSAYHMNIYDEYDYRHTDEQTEAYNIYIQQLHDSNTTLEQAEEMLGNILGDVERFATDERSQLIGQSDALQDYITELERQKENKRAEAENSAENTDANHVEEADVEENESAEPVEADKSKQYGEYKEVYDNFVSDVENRGMIPDLRAIKNKIRDTKRRLTVLRNGAATSIQSDEDLKRFEAAEKKLTDLLHVYEAMRDYTEARIKKAEAAAQRKPWSEKNAQERMDEASKNPLTEEEIQNAPTDEVNKANALDYLSGNHGLIQSISYLKVYEDVRNPNGSAASDSGTKDKTQLAGRSNSASEGRDTGGKSGGTAGRVDNGGSRENVSEQSDGGKSGERSTRDNAGEGSNTDIPTEEQPVGRRDANSGKPRRGGTSGRTRSDGGRSGRGESGNPATENGTRRAASESVKDESADDFLNQALGEFKDVLDDFIKAGRGELSISLVGLNSKQMEILPRLIQVGAKVGYAYIRKGVHGFTEWANHVKEAIGKYLRDANLSDDEIDAFIKEMWKSKIPFDGQIHTLEEWASIYSKKDLRNKVRTTIEEKREAQRQAESISVKTGDINNIRETLPFLLPQQQEDVLRAETQFFDETHQDREHANGKGYMFTNGTGTGKTYTGLGIVKRFVKQGKKRILILTPSQPKVRDWINDGKNLGLEIKSLDDWAKERGTTATTEAGEGTIITTYANFRQNEELLNGTFDLIVYDESHRLMENKNAANTIGTNQHHMIANRDAAFATIRLRKINPFYQERDKVNDEFKKKREQLVKELTQENPNEMDGSLVSKGLIPHSTYAFNWHEEDTERFPEFAQLHNRFHELTETIIKEVDPQIEEQAKKDAAHTKVVFLSATPFNTRENIDYAQGYIFSYPDKEQTRGYSIASPMTIFFEEHFGAAYKWRYGRLEHSERNAEAIAQQEREFSDWLQHTLCTMSGRIIDSEYDYSRDFPVVSVEHAEEINNAAEEILRDKYFNMAYHKVFGNYNYAGALFETLKVATLIPRIKQHLEAGRKVVIFHRRVESKTPLIPPFAAMLSACHAIIDEMKMKNKPKEEIDAARHRLEELKEKWRGLLKWESMLDYSMPREQIAKAFGADNVLYFSGQESTKVKNQAVDSFNNDESGKNIIVIQEASGKEGISLHDTTGKHQRVLITLALPQSPITALQIEGRIYRIGNRSNAIFEYPLLGLNSEIILFGQKFNGQIGTTENLALGSQARNLRESFARSVEESGKDVPIEEQGFGGKEADAAERDETSPFDRAVLDYYGNQKLKGKRDSREGVDYYPTPEPLGFKMVEWGNLNDGETALEPSAGHGAIARYVPSANPLTAIEPSQNLFAKLQLKAGGSGRKFVNTIFEGYNVVNKHDVIFMNPPFGTGGRLAVDHVAKAFTHLTEGGRIVAIIPRGSTDKKFDKWIDEQENAVVTGEIMLPDITFQQAGTSVMARVLVIDKVTNQSLRSEAESKYRRIDLSRRKYDKIEDFFEDIRDIQMPSRTIDEKARMLKRAAPALRDIKELKGVVDVQAQDDGIDIRTKGSAMGFYLDLTVSDFSLQQQLRTKYQRYAQEIEWNEHRHNEKAVEIYKAYNDLVCRLLGKTAEEVESDITREKMGLEQPHEEQGVAINVASQAEESPSSEQNESTTESSPYHYELKHHTKTGAEMFMAMPNEKSGLSSEEYSSMLAKAKKHGGYWNRFMKGFAFPSEKSAKDFLAETGNTEQKPSRGNLYRQGEELSPNHEIRIVEGDENHGFKNYKEAKSWAKSNIARTYSNEETGGKGEIRISNAAIDKYLSESAIEKSDSKDVHMAVLRVLPDVIRESVDAEQHADYLKGKDGMRDKKNGINPDVTIHRLYGAVRMNGKLYRVKVTLKENKRTRETTKAYSYEATKIELLAGQHGDVTMTSPRNSNNSITAANLLKGVEKSYDAGHFFEGYSEKIAEKTRQEKTQAAQKATENLNLSGRVVVHESTEGFEGKEATAKGWYDTRTGQIHVVLSNNTDAADVTQTILHEAVAHHGLRELFGHNVMDAFLDSVLAAASQEVKDAINELRRGKGWNFRTATEEYLAGLAERTDFERMTAEKRGLFATLRRLFNRALEFLGLKNRELSDRELAYILWCSYQNLKAGEKGRYVAEAERIAMRYKLKAGKNAMTDTEKKEHSVLLRGKLDNLQEILAKDTYERLVTRGSHLERTAWVDMLSPLQDLQHAIEKNGGFKLGDFENPYNAYITMSSRNYAQMDIYKRTLYADMIEAIHALGSETGRSYEEIKTYVMAKHGMERQKYMAGKAAEEAYDRYKSMHPFGQKTLDYFIDEYEEKSFAGLTELFGTQSVSDAMDEAQKYVEEVESEAGSLTDSMWDSIRAATKSSLQRAYEAGLISKETYDNVSSMYQYYIPLRGFDETTSDEVYEYFGDQTINGGTGSFMKKAKGRKSVADDPFAVIGNMAEMAIMQSNRNLMKQQLLNLALNYPSDLISVSDLYMKFDEDYDNGDGTRGAWVPVAVPDTSGMTTEEANQVMLDFQDDMEEKVKAEPDTYALAHQKPHIPYRVLGRNMNEHQVMVKRGGKTYILTINGNPRAAQAINGLLNPDATENPGAIALKAMTNWIARMATARNVEFAISNAMRDLEFSTTLIPKEGTEYYGRYVKNYLTCVKNIGRLVNRLNDNILDMSNPLEKAFYDFIYNGGETGYTFMSSTIIIDFQRVAKTHNKMCDTFCNSFY